MLTDGRTDSWLPAVAFKRRREESPDSIGQRQLLTATGVIPGKVPQKRHNHPPKGIGNGETSGVRAHSSHG